MDEPRNTDNAWIETTACHFHCSRELGAMLPLKPQPDPLTDEQKKTFEEYQNIGARRNLTSTEELSRKKFKEEIGLNEIFWLDIEDAKDSQDIYASHRDWILVVEQRLNQMRAYPGLGCTVGPRGRP